MIETAKDIWDFSLSKEIAVTAEYFQQSLNVAADLTFQNFRDLNPTGWPNESGFQKWICLHSELLIRSQILWHRLQILRVKQQMLPKKIGEEGYYYMHLLIFHRKIFFEGQNRGSPNDINHTTLASANVVQSNT